MSALKYDGDKPQLYLLDVDATEGLARVLTFGARKYAAFNWCKGFAWSRLISSTLRHFFAFMRGEDYDAETGLPHIDHVAANVMFLSAHFHRRLGTDDRFKTVGSIESQQESTDDRFKTHRAEGHPSLLSQEENTTGGAGQGTPADSSPVAPGGRLRGGSTDSLREDGCVGDDTAVGSSAGPFIYVIRPYEPTSGTSKGLFYGPFASKEEARVFVSKLHPEYTYFVRSYPQEL